MRDPKRIKVILKNLELLWKEHPDLRLGQLLEICKDESGSGADMFCIEDDKMQLGIGNYYHKTKAAKLIKG